MEINVSHPKTDDEIGGIKELRNLIKNSPIPGNEILENLGLYMPRQSLTRLIFMNDLYKMILNINGVVMEFGTRWGQNIALFNNFRAIYEPYNFTRKIIGFDTFEGFLNLDEKDGKVKLLG